MTAFENLINIIITFLSDFIKIDFTNYSGNLNPVVIDIYNKMTIIIPYICISLCIYFLYKIFAFLFRGFRK